MDTVQRFWHTDAVPDTGQPDHWVAQCGWIKDVPNYETEKERMRLPRRGKRQTKQIEKEGRENTH